MKRQRNTLEDRSRAAPSAGAATVEECSSAPSVLPMDTSMGGEAPQADSRIQLEGMIDMERAMELKRELVLALQSGKPITVCLRKITDLHVSAVQLLWAAAREAEKAGLPFRYSGALAEVVQAKLRVAGLDSFFPSEEAL